MCSTQITVITTICTTGLGWFVGYLSARRVSNLNSQAIAFSDFRKAFAPALAFIYLGKKHGNADGVPEPDVNKFLRDNLHIHAIAIEEFRRYIPKSKRTEYQDAWEKYRHEVWNYGFDSNACNPDLDAYKIYEDLIHNITSFAKEK